MGELELKSLLESVARAAAAEVMRHVSPSSDELSKREAEKLHGRKWLAYALRNNLIHPIRKGEAKNSKFYISRAECVAAWEATVNDTATTIKR